MKYIEVEISEKLETKEDILEVVDALHSKAMEDCGAIDDINKTSPALVLTERLLDFANRLKD